MGYELEPERAQFVASLAKGYCCLGNRANNDKRIAVILANYPTKDGRIGNGVGLDTPQSAINVLHAMQNAGYAVDTIPENGNGLIEALLESVTNNPNTLHHLPCWQSLEVAVYTKHFSKLPRSCQAVSSHAYLSSFGCWHPLQPSPDHCYSHSSRAASQA